MDAKNNPDINTTQIAWHPAFVEALQMELAAYKNVLEFHSEFQLTSEPLKIDCVVIKKAKDVVIDKNIARLFRERNLMEYKSPDDYISVADFYKVYGYACLYASFEKVPITSLTISFVESRYPGKLLKHLHKVRGYTIAEKSPGIYTINGDILPVQIIDSRKLSLDDNLWLKSLSNRLNSVEFRQVSMEVYRQGKAARLGAFLDAIALANSDALREAMNMDARLKLEKVFEETGLTAKWEAKGKAEGEAKGRAEVAKNLVSLGLPIETVISATQLDPEKIKAMYPC